MKVLNQLLSNFHLWKINKLAKFNQPKQYNNYKHSESKQESHETFRYKMVKYMTKSIQQQLHTYYKIIKSLALSMWGGANWLERKKKQEKVEKVKQKVYKMVILLYYYDYYYYSLFKKTHTLISKKKDSTKHYNNWWVTVYTHTNTRPSSGCCLLYWKWNLGQL